MDAVKFLKIKNMICEKAKDCDVCPLSNDTLGCQAGVAVNQQNTEEKLVDIVEQWAKENTKTRQDIFLERYPEAKIRSDGIINISPCTVNKHYSNSKWCKDDRTFVDCNKCRKDYWNEVVSDD